MNPTSPNIRELTFEELQAFIESKNLKKYRAKQVWEWLWKFNVPSFGEMSNLPLEIRCMLEENFSIRTVVVDTVQVSNDRTIKSAFKLHDGNIVEGVLIPAETRMTACVSSQVGCSLTCKFCATGKMERIRNLNADEIYDQVRLIREQSMEHYQAPLTNIVFMGMGEPLLNYENVVRSIERINSQVGLGMSQQRITVSTAGIAKMIRRLGDEEQKFNLALSLHAANDEKRNRIMPINESNNLAVLAEALEHYHRKTDKHVTYEYIVFRDFNDELNDARELAEFAKIVPSKINLIEYNPIDKENFQNASEEKLMAFKNYLHKQGFIVNLRRSRGKDIDAACGQLANKNEHAVVRLKREYR